MEAARKIRSELAASNFRVILDEREGTSPGFKFNDWEMRGVPLRIEIGPKDVAKGTVVLARRDKPGKEGKSFVPQAGLSDAVTQALDSIQKALYDRALNFREANTADPKDYRGIQGGGGEGLCLFVLVRKRAVRKKHQGRYKGHFALHSSRSTQGYWELHLLRAAGPRKSLFRQSLLTIDDLRLTNDDWKHTPAGMAGVSISSC